MPKWKIIIPVIIVILVGIIAYLQVITRRVTDSISVDERSVKVDELAPLDVTGKEGLDVQTEALINEFLLESENEDAATIRDDAEIINSNTDESDQQIFDVELYEE
jgi:hypothetical protein